MKVGHKDAYLSSITRLEPKLESEMAGSTLGVIISISKPTPHNIGHISTMDMKLMDKR